jgi:hypothetical protein
MAERMSWKDDERLYQPHIHSKRIRELHKLAELSGKPMTTLIDLALRKFVDESTIPSPTSTLSTNPVLNLKSEEGST